MNGYQFTGSSKVTGRPEDTELVFNVGTTDVAQQTYIKNRIMRIRDSKWHFYVATYDAKSQLMKDYFDGVPIATGGQGNLEIGDRFVVTGTDAQIDELQIYDRELSVGKVKVLFAKGPTGSTT